MQSKYLSINEVLLSFETGEPLHDHVLAASIARAKADPNVWNVFLLISPDDYSRQRLRLQGFGFVVTGNVSENATTLLKLKCPIRTSGETGTRELAVAPPTIPPSQEERAALAQLDPNRYSDEVVSRNVARIMATEGRKSEADNSRTLAEAALRTQYRREGQ
jgi:hypothetical protein